MFEAARQRSCGTGQWAGGEEAWGGVGRRDGFAHRAVGRRWRDGLVGRRVVALRGCEAAARLSHCICGRGAGRIVLQDWRNVLKGKRTVKGFENHVVDTLDGRSRLSSVVQAPPLPGDIFRCP